MLEKKCNANQSTWEKHEMNLGAKNAPTICFTS